MRELTKILVTGGSGFIGHAVQDELRRAFYPLHALMRPSSDPQISCRLGSRIFRSDVTDRSSMRPAFAAGTEAVVHTVGIIDEERAGDFARIHVEGTRNVVELAREFGIKKLVHISAMGTRANARSTYHKTKFTAEELVAKAGVPYTILRPSVVFGEGSEFLATLEMLARTPLFTPIIGSGQGKLQPIYVSDLARIVRQCLEDDRTDGQTYDLGGPEVLSLDQMFRVVEGRLGHTGKRHRYFPISMGETFAWLSNMGPIKMGLDWVRRNVLPVPKLNEDQLIMMQEDSVADASKAKSVFDWEFTKFSDWVTSPEYVERPWRGWKSRWLITPPGDPAPASGAGKGTIPRSS
jgi:NADH dehydrogenase